MFYTTQIELFPELNEQEKKQMEEAANTLKDMAQRYEQQLNGTRADDLQVGGTHYKEMGIPPWDVMEAVLTPAEFRGFLCGNVIKYAMRQGKKDSDDANKARHYAMKLKELDEKMRNMRQTQTSGRLPSQ